MGLHAHGGGLDQTAWMPFVAVSICWLLQFYNVQILLQWPRQFELLKWRSVKARGACKACRFYVSLNLLHVYQLVDTFFFFFIIFFFIYFTTFYFSAGDPRVRNHNRLNFYSTTTEWLVIKDRSCSERRQMIIIIIIIIIILWTVCSNKQTDDSCS